VIAVAAGLGCANRIDPGAVGDLAADVQTHELSLREPGLHSHLLAIRRTPAMAPRTKTD
jgi:hypothetical protein